MIRWIFFILMLFNQVQASGLSRYQLGKYSIEVLESKGGELAFSVDLANLFLGARIWKQKGFSQSVLLYQNKHFVTKEALQNCLLITLRRAKWFWCLYWMLAPGIQRLSAFVRGLGEDKGQSREEEGDFDTLLWDIGFQFRESKTQPGLLTSIFKHKKDFELLFQSQLVYMVCQPGKGCDKTVHALPIHQ